MQDLSNSFADWKRKNIALALFHLIAYLFTIGPSNSTILIQELI